MSDKLDKWVVIAGSVALAAVLCVEILANSAVYSDGCNRDDAYPMTVRTMLWFGPSRD